ncbi:MAG: DUF5828 family protein [Candidatus Nanosalina sp.]
MSDESIEETNSGLKKQGDWSEITEFGLKIQSFLEDEISGSNSLERFKKWRPKLEESEADVKRKTVDEAVIHETELEKQSNGAKEDLKQASDKVAEAGKKAANKEVPEKEIVEASEEAAKPFYTRIIGLFRRFESLVYSWLTLRFNPYYLDTKKFSVDIRDRKNGEFEMDVAVQEEDTREKMKDDLKGDE